MKKLKQFIDNDLKYFSNLKNNEIEYYDINEFDNDVIEYLKQSFRNRFDYKDICVSYDEDENVICIENMI